MQNSKQDYKHLEECFEQLQGAYKSAIEEIKLLKMDIEILKEVCYDNYIEVPELGGPLPFD